MLNKRSILNLFIIFLVNVLIIGCKPKTQSSTTKATSIDSMKIWKYGVLPYKFSPAVTFQTKGKVRKAIGHIKGNTDINLLDYDTAKSEGYPVDRYIMIIDSESGCSTDGLGMPVYRAISTLNLDERCDIASAIHEFIHAVGFAHEQQHPNSTLDIRMDRVISGKEDQYDRPDIIALGTYDPDSIMHYASKGFSICDAPSDVKWQNFSEDTPLGKCRAAGFNPDLVPDIDCMKECSVMLRDDKIFGRHAKVLSEGDKKAIAELYENEYVSRQEFLQGRVGVGSTTSNSAPNYDENLQGPQTSVRPTFNDTDFKSNGSLQGSNTNSGATGCTDIALDTKYSCEQQAKCGKCNESWMQGHCLKSCGKCQ